MRQQFTSPIEQVWLARSNFGCALVFVNSLEGIAQLLFDLREFVMKLSFFLATVRVARVGCRKVVTGIRVGADIVIAENLRSQVGARFPEFACLLGICSRRVVSR